MSQLFTGGRALAIFDLDGTLVNTLSDLSRCGNLALAACGFPTHPLEDYRLLVGSGVFTLMERALPEGHRDEATVLRAKALFDATYAAGYLETSRPYAGVEEALRALGEAGVALGVLSNKPHAFTANMVKALFPGVFAAISGQREGVPKKPDPTGVYQVVERAAGTLGRTLYIGDSDVDVYTAHNAGVRAIGCTWGFRGEGELAAAGADMLANSPQELPRLILEALG